MTELTTWFVFYRDSTTKDTDAIPQVLPPTFGDLRMTISTEYKLDFYNESNSILHGEFKENTGNARGRACVSDDAGYNRLLATIKRVGVKDLRFSSESNDPTRK